MSNDTFLLVAWLLVQVGAIGLVAAVYLVLFLVEKCLILKGKFLSAEAQHLTTPRSKKAETD